MAQMIRRELLPGVRLRCVHTDKFKSSYLSLTMLTPLTEETAAVNALVPAVLRRGTAVHPDMEALSAALDELYGGAIEPVVRKKGETQCVGFAAGFLDDAYALNGEHILEGAAGLLGELLLKPAVENGVFRADYVDSEKVNLIDELRGRINDKRRYATQRLVRLMCAEEAFGIDKLGDEPHVAAVTPQTLWDAYRRLLSTSEIELYYCGSADPARVEEILKRALSGLPRGGETAECACDVRLHAPSEPNVVVETLDVTQGKLAMGWRTGGVTCWEEDFPALLMCSAVFGGTTMSKLFMNVREKLSLCYYASSAVEKLKGLLLVSSGVEFDKYEIAKAEILAQLEAVRGGGIEDWELEGARRILVGGCLSALDDQSSQEEFWLGQAAAGLDGDIDALVGALEAVTKEQIVAAAQKLELDTVYFLKGKEG